MSTHNIPFLIQNNNNNNNKIKKKKKKNKQINKKNQILNLQLCDFFSRDLQSSSK